MTAERLNNAIRRCVCWTVFIVLLVTYWLTTPTTISYWDCPEYVSAAYLLEIGHPPGNPLWMLVERIITIFVPARYAAYAINLSSGLFTAWSCALMAAAIFPAALWIIRRRRMASIPDGVAAGATALIAALSFGWCDSAWYSAVEAEVYAMSIFFTALSVWLMTRWAFNHDPRRGNRILVLVAYVLGLSLGVHQLNLLVLPAFALMWGLRRGIRNPWKLLLLVAIGCVSVGVVLVGVMPGTIAVAAKLELLMVNHWGLPPLSGVAAFVILLGIFLLAALAITAHFAGNRHYDTRRLNLVIWMAAMLLTGYSVYAIIPIRGDIPSPANPTMPGEPFAFAEYQAREQYGSAPLLYGPTPYSKPMLQEEWVDGKPVYRRYALKRGHRLVTPAEPNARLDTDHSRLLPSDSAANADLLHSDRAGYLVRGYVLKNIYTPELNMWFPRITSRDPSDLRSFADWAGMDTTTMDKVAVSAALDTLGRPVGRLDRQGVRVREYSYRPTMMQNMRMLFGYQVSYMYMRYLLWNFVGRQNDLPSQGEVQHGNFITGFTPIDNAMLGAEEALPPEAGSDNPGRNRYYALPFILGIVGLIWLINAGKRGRSVAASTFLLFFMTGIAIVIYLNQSPGEPRERDYSFLGSFWTFAVWIGFGALAFARALRTQWAFLVALLVPVWMCVENRDDHDRRGREAARNIAVSTLESLDPNAILFVDGDNFTFPLWYAQEVEGIRRDVRVINVSYLSIPRYTANLMQPWRQAPAVPFTLTRGDILYGALSPIYLEPGSRDTLPAPEILNRLREPGNNRIRARYALIPVASGDTMAFDLRNLTNGSDMVPFHRLMAFDIIATNAWKPTERPIYLNRLLPSSGKIYVPSEALSPTLSGFRYGTRNDDAILDEMRRAVNAVIAPNDTSRHVYMDATPARMVANLRASLLFTARHQLRSGRIDDARVTLHKADRLMGTDPDSYGFASDNGEVIDVRKELGRTQIELADSLDGRRDVTHAENLRKRGCHNIMMARRRMDQWQRYRESLPPRLRPLMSPLN